MYSPEAAADIHVSYSGNKTIRKRHVLKNVSRCEGHCRFHRFEEDKCHYYTHTRALLRITATTRQIDTRSEESKKQPVEEKTNSQDGVETSVKH